MRLRTIITSFLLLLSAVAVSAAPHTFKHISVDDGLSSNNVKSICRDSYGFMWFGTKGGLNRYDGRNVTAIKVWDSKLNRGNNNVGALYEDNQKRLWVGTDRGVYIYDQVKQSFRYLDLNDSKGHSPSNWVEEIAADPNGNIWVLVPDQGVFMLDPEISELQHFPIVYNPERKNHSPTALHITEKGDVYVSTIGLGLFKYITKNKRFESIVSPNMDLTGMNIQQITSTPSGEMLIGCRDGEIFRMNPHTFIVNKLDFSGADNVYLRTLDCFDDDLWIGTYHGLYVKNLLTGSEEHYDYSPSSRYGLSDYVIYDAFRDPNGGVWIGTLFGGVSYYDPSSLVFTCHDNPVNTPYRNIRGVALAPDGKVWVGTEGNGVFAYDPESDSWSKIPDYPGSERITLMIYNLGDGHMRVGTSALGLLEYSGDGRPVCHFNGIIEDSSVYSYMIDGQGREWVGPGYGLFMSDTLGGELKRVEAFGNDWMHHIFEDNRGNIWISTMGTGIGRIDPDGGYHRYVADGTTPTGLRSNSVSFGMQDSKGRIWFSTDRGGISMYRPASDDFESFGSEEGLPDDVAYEILEDKNGNLWFGTNRGLVKFSPETRQVRVFTTFDGLPSNQFNYNTATADRSGKFYFGTSRGLFSFDPLTDNEPGHSPQIFFTRLKVYDNEITPQSPEGILKTNIMFADKIELPYAISTFSLNVTDMNGGSDRNEHLLYRLLPNDKEWSPVDADGAIPFTNLASGSYKLVVKSVCGNEEHARSLDITIKSPWFWSWWSIMLYVLVVIALCVLLFLKYRRRKEFEFNERQDIFLVTKEKEMNENKVRFFTEIAHEIRTPVTLISSPLEAIKDMKIKNDELNHYIDIMGSNVQRLLGLTSQLLDFQKIDNKQMTLKYEAVDVAEMATGIICRFEAAIKLKHRDLQIDVPADGILAVIDREAITKIMSNMLNNAMKYSKSYIKVSLKSDDRQFFFSVVTDGDKIIGDNVRRIFEPFYQMTNRADSQAGGVGIGLPLSRSLARLHGGNLTLVDDNEPMANTFILQIPLNKEGKVDANSAVPSGVEVLEEESSQVAEQESRNAILLVEDNEQMREFVAEQLGKHFTVECAENGKVALDMLAKRQYELIITDVMMPEMDGFELCRRVKSDIDISHIPVVMLTAKNDIDTKVEGLKSGAEAYVEKPFSVKFLLQLVISILENRKRERNAFAKKPFFSIENMQTNKVDEEFMNKVIKLVEDNITENEFGVERMCALLCMSRSSLLRKIKSLFNMSPLELIRLIKLKKAAELIQERRYLIGDVCYMVGINSPSYFSKLFFKQFGFTPKDFEKECHAGNITKIDILKPPKQ